VGAAARRRRKAGACRSTSSAAITATLATQGEEAIGKTSTPAILDTTRLNTGERMRFFTDFADTIPRVNRGRLRLVIDEAHLLAPRAGTRDAGAMPDLPRAANNLISLGRSRGLCIILISQRPAKVHKYSLTQLGTLVAITTTPHKPMGRRWLSRHKRLTAGNGRSWRIFGHRSQAGRAREEERFASKMVRIDVPTKGDAAANGWETHWYGGKSIFSYARTDDDSVMHSNRPARYRLPPSEEQAETTTT
jgi:hypothetical protein